MTLDEYRDEVIVLALDQLRRVGLTDVCTDSIDRCYRQNKSVEEAVELAVDDTWYHDGWKVQ